MLQSDGPDRDDLGLEPDDCMACRGSGVQADPVRMLLSTCASCDGSGKDDR